MKRKLVKKISLICLLFVTLSCAGGNDNQNDPDTCSADNQNCGQGRFCDFNDNSCGAGVGICRTIPDVCIELYAPVCGCNGITYGNDCFAQGAGQSVIKEGECS